jgi:hypothetical protein
MENVRSDNIRQRYEAQLQDLEEQMRARGEQLPRQENMEAANNSAPAEISRVAMRLPPFWAERPAV